MNTPSTDNPPSLADEIALLAAQVDVGTHRLLTCIRQFDESEEWGHQGARTCADWLAWRIGLTPGAAREKVRVARALGRCPAIDAAMASGRLSYAKVRALTRVATTTNEAPLVDIALAATGAQLERLCRRFRRVVDDGAVPGMEPVFDPSCDARGFHHRLLHEGGFKMSMDGERIARFFTSRGREIARVPDVPPGSMPPPAAIDDPDVNRCPWDGEPVDYDASLDAMCVASG